MSQQSHSSWEAKYTEPAYPITTNNYGFVWGEVLVQRIAANAKKPKFQVLSVYAPNGEIVEITMTPRKTSVKRIPRAKR